ncbi:MAG: nucleotide exchange factor GrpE [Planctomycetota bacterium]|nr:nucleotide exchange factor GrpE [Planctomycetota bacterium]
MSQGEFSADAKAPLPDDPPEDDASEQPAPAESSEESEDQKIAREMRSLDDESLVELGKRAGERDAYRDELLRVKAELDNYQKRVRRERPNWEDQAVRRFLGDLLHVVDSFELALESDVGQGPEAGSPLRQGVEMIYQLLQKTLSDSGVEPIAGAGEVFDPEVHEAVAEVTTEDQETGRIVDVQKKGYLYKGVLIRPSQVIVAKRSPEVPAARESSDGEDEETAAGS